MSKSTPSRSTAGGALRVNEVDVLCGNGNFANQQGNALCYSMIASRLGAFQSAGGEDRVAVVHDVYTSMQSQYGSRFLDAKTQTILPRDVALKKLQRLFSSAKHRKWGGGGAATTTNNTTTGDASTSTSSSASTSEVATTPAKRSKTPTKTPPRKRKDPPANMATTPTSKSTATPGKTTSKATPTPKKKAATVAANTMNPSNKNKDKVVVVARNRLLRGTLTTEHALKLMKELRFSSPQAQEKAMLKFMEQLEAEKDDLKEFCKRRLEELMVARAQQVGLTVIKGDSEHNNKSVPCENLDDIVEAWCQDGSVENQRKVHATIQEPFQSTGKQGNPLLLQVEAEYMARYNFVYSGATSTSGGESDNNSRGYIYDILGLQLNYMQQRTKQRGIKRHGYWMGSTKDERYVQGPDKKRIKVDVPPTDETTSNKTNKNQKALDTKPAARKKAPKTTTPTNTKYASDGDSHKPKNEMPVPTAKDLPTMTNNVDASIPTTVEVTCDNVSLATEETSFMGASLLSRSSNKRDNQQPYHSEDVVGNSADTTAAVVVLDEGSSVPLDETKSTVAFVKAFCMAAMAVMVEKMTPTTRLERAHVAVLASICATIWVVHELTPGINVLWAFSD